VTYYPALAGLGATLVVMLCAWIMSVIRRDVSIVDIFWSLSILAATVVYAAAQPQSHARGLLVLLLVSLWALRLAGHILWRNRGRPEDRRYRAMREKRGASFWWKSLYIVFALQALLAWIISAPAYGAAAGAAPLGWLDGAGVALWLAGFAFETVSDYQLSRFLGRPDRGDAVMDRGLWRYSRHPNYFGEFCLWWGLYLVALSAGAWWTIVGPLLLSFFLLKVSGVALTEKDIAERRPAYRDYVAKTSAFFPRPPRAA